MKTAIKKQTHIAKIREQNQGQIDKVCELLEWTREDYTNHQYHEYEMFVYKAFPSLPYAGQSVRYSSQFRGFYVNEWFTRNEIDFLPYATDLVTDELDLIYASDFFSQDWTRKEIGVRVNQGVEYGNSFLIEEYLQIHSHQSLFCDADFINKYRHFLNQILPYV